MPHLQESMNASEGLSGPLALDIDTWFQVHRDRDEYCCHIALRSAEVSLGCTGYSEAPTFFSRQFLR